MDMTPPKRARDFHGTHAAGPRQPSQLVEWSPPAPRTDRIRVRDHTCSCRFPTYELCTAAGLSFVRRTTSDKTITESPWLPSREAQQLWQKILHGQAW
ncbi:hypothetical protein GCM10012278_90540 [Nonomuraea glycinis]|uniref:Uncharacterized protein n=1 Tax=Nonomuraea glycinis TaxID=2047744 RepID=A0A918AFX9_9ACTN|nr:hypothetical protein GCM10012278_90540 [Nonomuraea glycinis]